MRQISAGDKCKKPLLKEQGFRMWSAREDYSSLRDSPCGPLLKQRSLALLESNLLPRRSSSLQPSDAKNPAQRAGFSNVVGERGFEPPTHWSQTSCATKLRYSPNAERILLLRSASVNPLFCKSLSIGYKVARPATLRLSQRHPALYTSCYSR